MLVHATEEWGFTRGYTTSDTDAVADAFSAHHAFPSRQAASCAAIRDGKCDINSGATYESALLEGVSSGLCAMSDVDAALARTFQVRFDLGLFSPTISQPLTKLGLEVVGTPAASELSLQAAEQSLVLLSNNGPVLPFKTGTKLAVIGPFANVTKPLLGTHYKGYACADGGESCITTIVEAIGATNTGGETTYAEGAEEDKLVPGLLEAAVESAKAADAVVLVLGISDAAEKESHDRTSIDLPAVQHDLSAAILALGKPVAIVLINGGAVSIEAEATAPGKVAIIEALLPGAQGAAAIANGLFGRHPFGGRLPYTIYKASFVNETAMSQMDLTKDCGRTYRFYKGTPIFPFAWGLSLATTQLSVPKTGQTATIPTDGSANIVFNVSISNTGSVDASQVITAFWVPPVNLANSSILALRQLFAFDRAAVPSGQTKVVPIKVAASSFAVSDPASGDLVIFPGTYSLLFTDGSSSEGVTTQIVLTGSKVHVETFPSKN